MNKKYKKALNKNIKTFVQLIQLGFFCVFFFFFGMFICFLLCTTVFVFCCCCFGFNMVYVLFTISTLLVAVSL